MQINLSKTFKKQFARLRPKEQNRVLDCLDVFRTNQRDHQLRNHQLKGKYEGFQSIDITGDLRAIYRTVSADEAFFVAVGTHSQLYK